MGCTHCDFGFASVGIDAARVLSCAYRARLDYSVRHRNGQGYGAGLRPRLEHTLCMPRCASAGSL